MTFVPSVVTTTSASFSEARKRALRLYGDYIKYAPKIVEGYFLDISPQQVRVKIREEFEKHRYVRDLKVVDILLFKGRIEYEEITNMWKQKTHVMRYFQEDKTISKKSSDFLSQFYEGR